MHLLRSRSLVPTSLLRRPKVYCLFHPLGGQSQLNSTSRTCHWKMFRKVDLQEPAITAPNGDIEDQVKGLIERCIEVSGPAPWIHKERIVL
jgi:hypothetical protein